MPGTAATALLPVLTLIIGYFGTIWTEERRDKRLETREIAAEERRRVQAGADRRGNFELETLQRSYTALTELGRAAGRLFHAESMIAKTSGAFGTNLLPEDVSDAVFFGSRTARDAVDLLLDDQLRTAALDVLSELATLALLRDEPLASVDAKYKRFFNQLADVLDRIAAEIRKAYTDA